jgi:hypothetical protein
MLVDCIAKRIISLMAAITNPFYQTVRQFADGQYTEGGRSGYIVHLKYSKTPSRFVRGFELLQKDLLTLFEYIEPSKFSRDTYSFRTFELLLRTCTEIEANLKSILKANAYTLKIERDWNMHDYFKINRSHYLSEYKVMMPFWDGPERIREPFKNWKSANYEPLAWYSAYNTAKHDRANDLREASFHNLINAFCGLVVLLTSQYLDNDFKLRASSLTDQGPNDGYEDALGGYFRVQLPANVPMKERYDFNWENLINLQNPFQRFNYDKA